MAERNAIRLGPAGEAALRRVGQPWLPGIHLELTPGPHMFLDWRFVQPGEVGLSGPRWTDAAGTPLPLRLWDHPQHGGRDPGARFEPRDVPTGIRLAAQSADREGPFPHRGPPGQRILEVHGSYLTWYSTATGEQTVPLRCASSDDAYSWRDLGECRFDWSACPEAAGRQRSEIFLDPSGPDDERFKMFFRAAIPGAQADKRRLVERFLKERPESVVTVGRSVDHLSGMWGAVSADGISWRGLPGPLVLHYSDTTNIVHFDQRLQAYVWYARCNWYYGRRCIGRSQTSDFRHWPAPQLLVWPQADDHPADDWYTSSHTCYPGTAEHQLMFPALYHHNDDSSELALFSSPDGLVWSRVPGSVLTPGAAGSWDSGCVFGGGDLLALSGRRVALPYTGYRHPHKYPRNPETFRRLNGYATWPAGRLGGLVASEQGSFTTPPLVSAGSAVELNLRTRAAGAVWVEVADRDGVPLPGRSFAEADPVTGDHLAHRLSWRGETGVNLEQPRILRVRLQAAELFAFQVV